MSDALPVRTLFILPPREPGVLCTPGQHGLDGGVRADEDLFDCWKNKKKCFFLPLLWLRLPFGLVQSLRTHGSVPAVRVFSVSGCRGLLTAVEVPSVYIIPESPRNYGIL